MQGKKLLEQVRRFVIETKKNSPGLGYSQIAARLQGELALAIDKSTVGAILRGAGLGRATGSSQTAASSTGPGVDLTEPEKPPVGALSVSVETSCNGWDLRSRRYPSLLEPFAVSFALQNSSPVVIASLQLHVWLHVINSKFANIRN